MSAQLALHRRMQRHSVCSITGRPSSQQPLTDRLSMTSLEEELNLRLSQEGKRSSCLNSRLSMLFDTFGSDVTGRSRLSGLPPLSLIKLESFVPGSPTLMSPLSVHMLDLGEHQTPTTPSQSDPPRTPIEPLRLGRTPSFTAQFHRASRRRSSAPPIGSVDRGGHRTGDSERSPSLDERCLRLDEHRCQAWMEELATRRNEEAVLKDVEQSKGVPDQLLDPIRGPLPLGAGIKNSTGSLYDVDSSTQDLHEHALGCALSIMVLFNGKEGSFRISQRLLGQLNYEQLVNLCLRATSSEGPEVTIPNREQLQLHMLLSDTASHALGLSHPGSGLNLVPIDRWNETRQTSLQFLLLKSFMLHLAGREEAIRLYCNAHDDRLPDSLTASRYYLQSYLVDEAILSGQEDTKASRPSSRGPRGRESPKVASTPMEQNGTRHDKGVQSNWPSTDNPVSATFLRATRGLSWMSSSLSSLERALDDLVNSEPGLALPSAQQSTTVAVHAPAPTQTDALTSTPRPLTVNGRQTSRDRCMSSRFSEESEREHLDEGDHLEDGVQVQAKRKMSLARLPSLSRVATAASIKTVSRITTRSRSVSSASDASRSSVDDVTSLKSSNSSLASRIAAGRQALTNLIPVRLVRERRADRPTPRTLILVRPSTSGMLHEAPAISPALSTPSIHMPPELSQRLIEREQDHSRAMSGLDKDLPPPPPGDLEEDGDATLDAKHQHAASTLHGASRRSTSSGRVTALQADQHDLVDLVTLSSLPKIPSRFSSVESSVSSRQVAAGHAIPLSPLLEPLSSDSYNVHAAIRGRMALLRTASAEEMRSYRRASQLSGSDGFPRSIDPAKKLALFAQDSFENAERHKQAVMGKRTAEGIHHGNSPSERKDHPPPTRPNQIGRDSVHFDTSDDRRSMRPFTASASYASSSVATASHWKRCSEHRDPAMRDCVADLTASSQDAQRSAMNGTMQRRQSMQATASDTMVAVSAPPMTSTTRFESKTFYNAKKSSHRPERTGTAAWIKPARSFDLLRKGVGRFNTVHADQTRPSTDAPRESKEHRPSTARSALDRPLVPEEDAVPVKRSFFRRLRTPTSNGSPVSWGEGGGRSTPSTTSAGQVESEVTLHGYTSDSTAAISSPNIHASQWTLVASGLDRQRSLGESRPQTPTRVRPASRNEDGVAQAPTFSPSPRDSTRQGTFRHAATPTKGTGGAPLLASIRARGGRRRAWTSDGLL